MLVGLSICKFSWKILNWIHPRQNLPPPLWELLEALCLISPRCSTEHLNCSFVLTAIKLFNASLSVYWGRTPAVFTWTMLDCYLDQTSARTVVVFRKRRIWHYVLLCDPRTTGVKDSARVRSCLFCTSVLCMKLYINVACLLRHLVLTLINSIRHKLTVSWQHESLHVSFYTLRVWVRRRPPPDEASLERSQGQAVTSAECCMISILIKRICGISVFMCVSA